MQERDTVDKRVARSKAAIREAFFDLVLKERYDEIKVNDIILKSGVARSTFYEHYSNKDAVLACSLRYPMQVFAESISANAKTDSLEAILQHFWENRSLGRLVFTGIPRKSVTALLSALLKEQLDVRQCNSGGTLLISNSHAAKQIAESQMTLTTTWLQGEGSCSVEILALAIVNTSNAIVQGLERDGEGKVPTS